MNKKGFCNMRYIFPALILLLVSCHMEKRPVLPALETVAYVDLGRYAGEWYEIARFPHRFQEGCYGSKASYRLLKNGRVRVLNECRKGGPEGPPATAEGTARVVDSKTNAKLKVTFFWPFWGDYWIIDLGREYEYAVVGHPSRTYLWILSRTADMDDRLYEGIVERLETQHYDTSRLIKTFH